MSVATISAQEIQREKRRLRSLREANVIRSKRARLKQHIAAGDITLAEILRADKVHLHTMRLKDLLEAVPALGPAKTRRVLDANRISASITLEDFSFARRETLLIWITQSFPRVVVS